MTNFDRLLPPLATLVAFEAAYRHRSFTRAAEEIYTSQATVSRRVRELEVDLGISLFDRHRYDVTPTAAAETLVASVRLSLSELSSTANHLRRRGSENDSLTILASLALTSTMVAPVVSELQRKHPKLNVRVLSWCEPIESTREDFDVAVQYGPSESSRYNVEFIAEEAVFPVCSPSFAARLPLRVTPDDLARLPLLHVEYDDPSWTTWPDFLATAGAQDAECTGALVFSSYQVCLDLAERGEGVALGWERSVSSRIEAGTLVRVPGIVIPDAGMINAYLPNHPAAHRHALEFLTLLKGAQTAQNSYSGPSSPRVNRTLRRGQKPASAASR